MDNQVAMEAFQRRAARNTPAGGGGANRLSPPQMMSKPGMDQLKQSAPDEAMLIIKALIQRLRDLPPYKPQSQPSASA